MNISPNEVIKCESLKVKTITGSVFEFPVVDNKNMFPHFFKTQEVFDVQIQCSLLEDEAKAMYKRKDNIAYLICVWVKKEDINDKAMKEINERPKLSFLLN